MSKLYDIKLRQLQVYNQRLDALKSDFEEVNKQINLTTNAGDKNRLQRQSDGLLQELEQVAKQCDQLEQELRNLAQPKVASLSDTSLLMLLTPYESQVQLGLSQAYEAVRPADWIRPTPRTLKAFLNDLSDMPDEQSPILRFVASLVANNAIPQMLAQQLQQWGEQQGETFSDLLEQIRQETIATRDVAESYLMIVIEQNRSHDQKKGDRYRVKAWFVPDFQRCRSGSAVGYEPLSLPGVSEESEQTFMIAEMPKLLKHFLIESGKRCSRQRGLQNLTIELFVPSHLLNYEIEHWIEDEEVDFATPIGVEHRVILRSSDRLRPEYLIRRRGDWQSRWQQLRQAAQEAAYDRFVSADGMNPKVLFQQLKAQDRIGLKLIQGPLPVGKESAFAVLQVAALPAAIWLRQVLPSLNCVQEVEQLLNCAIADIPEVVKLSRCDAFPNDLDCHIGHHLSLLWEDYDRLPPDTLEIIES